MVQRWTLRRLSLNAAKGKTLVARLQRAKVGAVYRAWKVPLSTLRRLSLSKAKGNSEAFKNELERSEKQAFLKMRTFELLG